MKKILPALFMVFLWPYGTNGQVTHAGVDAGYGTSVGEAGFGLYGIYTVNEQIKLVPNFIYFLPHRITTNDGSQTFNWWTVNLDGNYVIRDGSVFQAYGLMGLSFINITGDQDEGMFQDHKSMLKLGLNAGAGFRLPLSDRLIPFAEIKLTLGDHAYFSFREVSTLQLGLAAGILLRIADDRDRNEDEF